MAIQRFLHCGFLHCAELAEGTVVEIIVLVEQDAVESAVNQHILKDTTEYLLSTEANRRHLMTAI